MGSSFDFTDDRGRDYSIKSVDKEEVDDGQKKDFSFSLLKNFKQITKLTSSDISKVKQEVRTIVTDLDSAYNNKKKDACEADIDPIYVEIQTLTKGQVFVIFLYLPYR